MIIVIFSSDGRGGMKRQFISSIAPPTIAEVGAACQFTVNQVFAPLIFFNRFYYVQIMSSAKHIYMFVVSAHLLIGLPTSASYPLSRLNQQGRSARD
jgi:hypothetical protein